MTTEIMRVLVEEDGITEEEARLRLRDDDLWVCCTRRCALTSTSRARRA